MKGDPRVIEELNKRLIEEASAIQQYSVHRSTMANWGYSRFVEYIQERIDDENKHYGMVLDRILLLGGAPAVGLNAVFVGDMADSMLSIDHQSESDAIAAYQRTIALCEEVGDHDTRRMLQEILSDEIDHIHDIEANLAQLAQIGTQNYLANQVG